MYDHADFCPIWNYIQALKERDLRYILKLDKYSNLPEPKVTTKVIKKGFKKTTVDEYDWTYDVLKEAWQNIQNTIENGLLEMDLELKKIELIHAFEEWLGGKYTGREVNESRMSKAWAQLRHECDKVYTNFTISEQTLIKYLEDSGEYTYKMFDNVFKDVVVPLVSLSGNKYKSLTQLDAAIKEVVKWEDLLKIRPYLLEYCHYENKYEVEFHEEITNIERVLKKNTIDPLTTSVNRYFSMRKQAYKAIEDSKRGTN